MANDKLPTTLIEAIRYFADLDKCTEFVARLRWDGTPTCDRCGSVESYYLAKRRVWKCKGCARQYSVKVGTIFEDSALGLDKWLPAVWLIANSKNGISSHELGRALGVTQKSAWFMLHRIRLAMATGSFEKMTGTVEVDETFVGGKAKNMHFKKRAGKNMRQGQHKSIVVGALQRGGEVRADVIADRSAFNLLGYVKWNVEDGSTVYTDSLPAYKHLRVTHTYAAVDHLAHQYVDGLVHSNGIENFWSILKRAINGTHIHVAPIHLYRYVDERVFAFNQRKESDFARFSKVLDAVSGRRLTYANLTGKA